MKQDIRIGFDYITQMKESNKTIEDLKREIRTAEIINRAKENDKRVR